MPPWPSRHPAPSPCTPSVALDGGHDETHFDKGSISVMTKVEERELARALELLVMPDQSTGAQ